MLASIATSVTLAGRSGMPRDVETAMRVAVGRASKEYGHRHAGSVICTSGRLTQAARLQRALKLALAGGQEQVVAFLEDFDSAVPNR